jgi:antitoxin component YwqK of YwqJK toxin-antitoxin module
LAANLPKGAKMKYFIGILTIVVFISGCNSKRFLEKMGLEEELTNVIQIRNEIAYLPDENDPFTGKYVEYYSTNGQKKSETSYKDGKQNGLFTSWYENGKMKSEANYSDGEVNGLFSWWYENGQKMSETDYIDGKANGVTIEWDENGQKKSETNNQNAN